ncbi:MAG: CoA pyrophosphatase [Oscillospiraceae bacterium]|nr:CoA pyrophosphatase [Oscillospiraceae bacterium]
MTVPELQLLLNSRTPGPMDTAASYAVLVPMVERNGELHLLYEVRAAALRRQPREVCFPGGRMEPGESAVDCALRETREELSIPADAIRILGPLDFICHRGGFVIYPILALIDPAAVDALCPNPAEVDEIFLVPLSALHSMIPVQYRYELVPRVSEDFPYELIGIGKDYRWQHGTETGPVYPWDGKAIWGLTGRITRHVLGFFCREVD